MKDLVKRLRGDVYVRDPLGRLRPLTAPELREAADAIKRLTQKRDEARSEVTRLRTIMRKEGLL